MFFVLLPVITRREFQYKTANPQAMDNPHTAVLSGYHSWKRDEKIAFANQVDFTASTVNECATRHKRYEQFNRFVELWQATTGESACDTGNCYLEEKGVFVCKNFYSVIATDWACGTFLLQSLTSDSFSLAC